MRSENKVHALIGCVYRGIRNAYDLLIASGWLRSRYPMQAMDRTGKPLPWLTYPAIEWLKQSIKPHWKVCEYGVGQSTIWFSTRCKVRGVERNPEWAKRVADINACITVQGDRTEYASFARASDTLVIIDGNWREDCAKHVCMVKPEMVILDNSWDYVAAVEVLRQTYTIEIPFVGFAPGMNIMATTLFLCPRKTSEGSL